MNAKEGYIVRLLDGTDKKFVIPVYQRPYSWKKANCDLLFNDLLEVYRHNYNSHFFGSLVYVENELGGYSEYIIIDGQQRLTTVSLLLLAIRNYIAKNRLDIGVNPSKITNAYLTDEYAHGAKKLKLKLVQGDDDAYDRLIEQTEPISTNNITVNYNYFYEKISELEEDELKGLYDSILKLMVVNISLKPHNGDDPQTIFESLNSTGLDLDESDKIRNYVLMNMSATDQEKVYKNYWEKLEKKIGKDDVSRFIRHYLAVKTRELANENKLYFAFKDFRDLNRDKEIVDILGDMLLFANFYQTIKTTTTSSTSYLGSIARINKLEINTVIPLLFDLFLAKEKGKLDEIEMGEALNIIESYIVRRIICGLPTSSLNKTFVYIGAEIEKYVEKSGATYLDALKYAVLNKTGKSRFPNDHDFAEKFVMFELYNAKPSARKYIFERLENQGTKERVAVEEQIDTGELTIEHIMPQSLTNDWKEYLGENWELIHTKYIDTVGNLTLTAYNSDYSNLIFAKKRDMKDKGFACSKLKLNESVAKCADWGEKQIKARAAEILMWGQSIWIYPSTDFVPSVIEDWIGLDEDMDFTNKTIVKYCLLGDEVASDNITDVYKKVSALLYSIDPVQFAGIESVNHNADMTKLRSAYELDSNMYIETNLSSQGKIDELRKLFEAMKIDLQELKFLVRAKTGNPGAFDIDDESTYSEITCGDLAYKLIAKLLIGGKISDDEIQLLMTKEYARSNFTKVVYPVLATSRDANRGESKNYRYYKTPISINGVDFYISSQWFDKSRKDLITWYKKH